ncbi:MAG: iaaH [Frankiales bacterium]|nr:iaaH [Frankiales bacterium]
MDGYAVLRADAANIALGAVLQAAARAAADYGAFIDIVEDIDPPPLAGRLAGVPFVAKDNINTVQLPTTAGTPSLRGSRTADATAIARLRSAGALLVGKANLHELAFGITSNNGGFGPVRNPVDPARSAGGSSGGSAAAVALGVVPFALGTDTGGSMRIPAAHCGVVGLRPTVGRYPGDGVAPLSHTRDTIGVFANSVLTVQLVDAVLAGEVFQEQAPLELSTVRLAVPRPGFYDDLDPDIELAVDRWLTTLSSAGVSLTDIDLSQVQHLDNQAGYPVVFYEVQRDLADYLHSLREPYSSLTVADLADQAGSPDVASALRAALASDLTEEDYRDGLLVRDRIRDLYQDALVAQQFDALIYPTVAMLPPPLGVDDRTQHNGHEVSVVGMSLRNTGPGSVAGMPSISLPGGRSRAGLPIGLSLEAYSGHDHRLLAVARAVEALDLNG